MNTLKRLFLSALLTVVGCLGLYSETSISGYTYASGELMPYGTSRAETLDVAMCIDNPALAGFKVTSVKAYLNANEGLQSASLWMSNDLKLEKKVNAPDIWSTPVEVVKGGCADPVNGKEYPVGVLEYTLAEPYELTGNPVYVGYSVNVTNVDTEELKKPILLSKAADSDGFFFHSNKSVIHWTNYSEKTGGAAVICLTLEKVASDASLGVSSVYPVYAPENDDFTVDVEVTNTGDVPVKTVSYRYGSEDGIGVRESVLEIPDPIDPNLVRPSVISLKMDGLSGLGSHVIPVEITEVNGLPNSSSAKTGKADVTVIPFVPKHRPLIEEYTGLWCKFCIRGYIGMELIREGYADDQVSVCFHNNDPMMVTTVYPIEPSGYPLATIDRGMTMDPYYGTYSDIDFGIRKNLETATRELAMADIDVVAAIDGMKVLVESSTRFIKDIKDANYQVGYVLTCDGLSNPGWLQTNAYSGAAGLEGTYLDQAVQWPERVAGLVFNDVAVDVTGMMGVEGSLPKDMLMGETYTHQYSFNLAYNQLIPSMDNVRVVAFIVDRNTGRIVNANKVNVGMPDSVVGITDSSEVIGSDYYDLMGRKVCRPTEGVFIRVDRLSDGRTVSAKVLR